MATAASLPKDEWSQISHELQVSSILLSLCIVLLLLFILYVFLINNTFKMPQKKCYPQEWQEVSKKAETSLKEQTLFDYIVNENIPPVRGSHCSVPIRVKLISTSTRNHVHLTALE